MHIISKNINTDEMPTNKYINYDDIPGWFYYIDEFLFKLLLNHQNKLNIPGNLLEVGVYHGKCFTFMHQFLKNDEKIIGIDVENFFLETQQKYDLYNNVDFRIIDSINFPNLNIDNIRFCHIDAAHNFENVYNDIKNTYKSLNYYGGIMVLDDFNTINYLNSIIAAYYKIIFIDKLDLCPFLISDNKIYLSNRRYANLYYNFLNANITKYVSEEFQNKLYIKSCSGNSIFNQPLISCSSNSNGVDIFEQSAIYNY